MYEENSAYEAFKRGFKKAILTITAIATIGAGAYLASKAYKPLRNSFAKMSMPEEYSGVVLEDNKITPSELEGILNGLKREIKIGDPKNKERMELIQSIDKYFNDPDNEEIRRKVIDGMYDLNGVVPSEDDYEKTKLSYNPREDLEKQKKENKKNLLLGLGGLGSIIIGYFFGKAAKRVKPE